MRRSSRRLLSAALLLVGAAAACGDDSALSGSLSDFYDVDFDRVRARLYPDSELAIEYARNNGEVPVRVTLRADNGALRPGTFNLPAQGAISGRSGATDIPSLDSATVDLDEFSASSGAAVVGSFDASFLTGDDTTSLNGDFDTTLEVIDEAVGFDLDGFPVGADCDNPIEVRLNALYRGVLDDNDSDDVGGLCGDGVDVVFRIALEEGRDVTLRLILDDGVQGTLQSESCAFGEQLGCYTGRQAQRMRLEAGVYYFVLDGEGEYRVEIND